MGQCNLSRRGFLGGVAALLAAHDAVIAQVARNRADAPDEPLIRGIRLRTIVPLAEMKAFYHTKLGFAVLAETSAEISFQAGGTRVSFVKMEPRKKKPAESETDLRREGPFYHFAFNIPHNKVLAARKWQLERTSLVPTPEHMRDPAFPDDVRHFRNWNAHSLFFFDPAFNIVEYIARHDLRNDARNPDVFASSDILYASEIGFLMERADQPKATKVIHEKLGLTGYRDPKESWWAMGDERGLLLCLGNIGGRGGGKWGENTPTPVTWGVFETEATVRVPGVKAGAFKIAEWPYRVEIEEPLPKP
jgi:hypothetical protein